MSPDFYTQGTKVNAIDPEGELVECMVVGVSYREPTIVYTLYHKTTDRLFHATPEYIVGRLR